MTTDGQSIHLVLGASGVRCFAYLGAAKALLERGFRFASVSGASSGSAVAAVLCSAKPIDDVIQWAIDLPLHALAGRPKFFKFLALWRWPFAIRGKTMFPEHVASFLGDMRTLGSLPIPFGTFAADIVSKRVLVYRSDAVPDMEIREVLDLAMALPTIYAPVERGSRILVDGAIVSSNPVWLPPAHDDQWPILSLSPQSNENFGVPSNVGHFIVSIVETGIAGHDEQFLRTTPRARRIVIDTGSVKHFDFSLSKQTLRALIDRGYDAIANVSSDELLRRVERPRPRVLARPAASASAEREDAAAAEAGKASYHLYFNAPVTGELAVGGNQISVGGSAIINIDSVLSNVTQTLGAAPGLDAAQKSELTRLVETFRTDLKAIEASHKEEAALIADSLSKVVAQASKPPAERKASMLTVTANGLKEAASTVAEIAPTLLTTAGAIASFVLGLAG